VAPPDPIPNSEVKHSIADGSVGFPHVRVGHFQAPNFSKESEKPIANAMGFFTSGIWGLKAFICDLMTISIRTDNWVADMPMRE
jgi:hypothetical protein